MSVQIGWHTSGRDPLPVNPSYVQSQLDGARASLRSKESKVAVLEHDRDNMRRELEEAREEMESLQEPEAIEKRAKAAASVQDENRRLPAEATLAEIKLGASLKADKARLQTGIGKKVKELSELQTRQSQRLARLGRARMGARSEGGRTRGCPSGDAKCAALERVAVPEEERAQAAVQDEAMKVIEEERRELLARLQTAQNGSAQAVPAPRAPRRPRRSLWASLWSARKVYALLCGRFVASSMQIYLYAIPWHVFDLLT
ncbi:hypothetical protein FOMPIDRAFT_93306 [Fomitopsis schrenkii]|uniref:Uncharacterized protein n=1 Tax=Fomitopsis schrenkii TaxID=2126942 RepID=S8F7C4_FOMSC|nr:hypothetical protein FOMPIDRAFT_93306 [Fomitopsis schrenkii]